MLAYDLCKAYHAHGEQSSIWTMKAMTERKKKKTDRKIKKYDEEKNLIIFQEKKKNKNALTK